MYFYKTLYKHTVEPQISGTRILSCKQETRGSRLIQSCDLKDNIKINLDNYLYGFLLGPIAIFINILQQ